MMKHSEIVFFSILSSLLFAGGLFYYNTFYSGLWSVFFALILTLQFVFLSLLVGYLALQIGKPSIAKGFAVVLSCSLLFMLTRFLVIYLSLQYHLPEDTIYRTPSRSWSFLLITNLIVATAIFIYALYRNLIAEHNLLKERLAKLEGTTEAAETFLKFYFDGEQVSIAYQEIRFLNAEREYTKITTLSRSYLTLDRLKNFEQRLPKPNFLRTHRSYIVNTAMVTQFDGKKVYLGNHPIPIGKSYQKHVAIELDSQRIAKKTSAANESTTEVNN